VIQSPFNIILPEARDIREVRRMMRQGEPIAVLSFVLTFTSAASSNTIFMYSSNPYGKRAEDTGSG
jgi:hypothetical protein